MIVEFKNESFTIWEEKHPGLMGFQVQLIHGGFTVEGDYECLGTILGNMPAEDSPEGMPLAIYRVRPGRTVVTMTPSRVRWLVWVPDIRFPYPRVMVVENEAQARVNVVLGERFPKGVNEDAVRADGTITRVRGRWQIAGLKGRTFYSRGDAEDVLHYLTTAEAWPYVWSDSDEVTSGKPPQVPRDLPREDVPNHWQHLLRG